jgi:hypothetical protein
MDKGGNCLSEAEKREAILQILNGPGDSTKTSQLRAIDPNWARIANDRRKDAGEKTTVQDDRPEKKKTTRVTKAPIALQSKPKTAVPPPVVTNGKQVPVGKGIITRLNVSIGETGREEELRNHKCPNDLHDACLDEADRRNWPGFSCVNCNNFRP